MDRSERAIAFLARGSTNLKAAQLVLERDAGGLAEVVVACCHDAVAGMLAAFLLANDCDLPTGSLRNLPVKAREAYPVLQPLVEPLSPYLEHFVASHYPYDDGPEFTGELAATVVQEVGRLEKRVRNTIETTKQ